MVKPEIIEITSGLCSAAPYWRSSHPSTWNTSKPTSWSSSDSAPKIASFAVSHSVASPPARRSRGGIRAAAPPRRGVVGVGGAFVAPSPSSASHAPLSLKRAWSIAASRRPTSADTRSWKPKRPSTCHGEPGASPASGAIAWTVRSVTAKRSTTITSISTVTESTAVVKRPCAPSSETSAIADDGERATARHATRSATAKLSRGSIFAVSGRNGAAAIRPPSTSAYVTPTRPSSTDITRRSWPRSSDSRNFEPAEKPMKPIASSLMMWPSACRSDASRSPIANGPHATPTRM